jgi:hypothetical protein
MLISLDNLLKRLTLRFIFNNEWCGFSVSGLLDQ